MTVRLLLTNAPKIAKQRERYLVRVTAANVLLTNIVLRSCCCCCCHGCCLCFRWCCRCWLCCCCFYCCRHLFWFGCCCCCWLCYVFIVVVIEVAVVVAVPNVLFLIFLPLSSCSKGTKKVTVKALKSGFFVMVRNFTIWCCRLAASL